MKSIIRIPIRRGARFILSCVLLALISACGSDKPEDLNDYLAWVHDPGNGHVAVQETNSGRTSLKLLPTEYLIARDRQGTSALSGDSATLRQHYDSCLYFLLTMERPSSTSDAVLGEQTQSNRGIEPLQQLSLTGRLREMFTIRSGERVIPSIAAWAETTGGLAVAQNLVVVFTRHEINGSDSIEVMFDSQSLGMGTQRFRFGTKDLERTPHI